MDHARASLVPPALQRVLDESRQPRSTEEDEAGRRLVLGPISLGEYLSTIRAVRARH
jgi:hypothetical protein